MSGDGNPIAVSAEGEIWSLDDSEARECRRSDLSYVKMAFLERVTNLACSGARMSDLTGGGGQIERAEKMARSEKNPGIIIGAGGNDVEWSALLSLCIATECVGAKRVAETEKRISSVIQEASDAVAARINKTQVFKRVWIVTYPNFAYRDNKTPCDGGAGALYSRITLQEWREMWERSGSLLNRALRAAAERHGWSVVEMEDVFFGHSVCDVEPYVRGFDNKTGLSGFGHPNKRGYERMSEIIKETVR